MSQTQADRNLKSLEDEIAALEKEFLGEQASETETEAVSTTEEPEQETEIVKTEETEEKPEKEEKSELSGEEKTYKKRYGDLKRHYDQKVKELKELKTSAKKTPTSKLPPLDEAKLEKWMEDNPEVASIILGIANRGAPQTEDFSERLKEIEEYRREVDVERAQAVLMRKHPDFEEIRADDAFHKWAESQPKVVQDALYDNETDGDAAARAVQLYKNEMGVGKEEVADKRKKKSIAAKSVNTKSTVSEPSEPAEKTYKESDVFNMTDEEFEKHEKDIFEAQKNGRFVYDISKKRA